MELIFFHVINKPYGKFITFNGHPITLDGLIWPTSEHYFQA